jgi:hypothetical protein
MKRAIVVALLLVGFGSGCLTPTPYQRVTKEWTRKRNLRGPYQEVMQLAAIYKSAAWRRAYAEKDATARGLAGAARDQRIAQAEADATGSFEIELLVTTWDRRENDLDRNAKSVWRVRLLDDSGAEIEPLEIVRDKRPILILRAEFPSMGDFATAYVAKFPRGKVDPSAVRLRVSSERGGVTVEWPTR